jgi:hypothetical protein
MTPAPGNGQDLNVYSYVNDRPTVFTDPTGMFRNIIVAGGGSSQTQMTDGGQTGEVVNVYGPSTINGIPMGLTTAELLTMSIGGRQAGGAASTGGEVVVVTGKKTKQVPIPLQYAIPFTDLGDLSTLANLNPNGRNAGPGRNAPSSPKPTCPSGPLAEALRWMVASGSVLDKAGQEDQLIAESIVGLGTASKNPKLC